MTDARERCPCRRALAYSSVSYFHMSLRHTERWSWRNSIGFVRFDVVTESGRTEVAYSMEIYKGTGTYSILAQERKREHSLILVRKASGVSPTCRRKILFAIQLGCMAQGRQILWDRPMTQRASG